MHNSQFKRKLKCKKISVFQPEDNYTKAAELCNNIQNLFQNEFRSVKFRRSESIFENCETFHQSIYPVIALAQVFGIMPVCGIAKKSTKDLKFKYLSTKFAYFVFVNIILFCLILITIMWMTLGHIKFTVSGSLVFYLTNYSISVCFLILARRWPQLMQLWENTEKQLPYFPEKKDLSGINVKTKLITIVLMTAALIEHSLSIISRVYKAHLCLPFCNPIEEYYTKWFQQIFYFTNYSLVTAICMQIVHFSCAFMWSFNDLFIIVVSVGIASRMKQINNGLRQARHKVATEKFFEVHRQYYRSVCDLLAAVDKALAWIILVSFFSNLYFTCLQLLNIIRPNENLIYAIYFWYSLAFLIIRTLAVALFAANVYEESRKPIEILQDVPKECYSPEVKRFMNEVLYNKIALTGNNFFYITPQLILKIAGTVITYELVLIQFQANNNQNS